MRKIIIDTDTASDDAVALIMALKSDEINVRAITTVCGNVPVEQATKNALMAIEIAGAQQPPVFKGEAKPLVRDSITSHHIHGRDGMGDCGLIHPSLRAESVGAVQAILDIVKTNPGEIEIVTIGPVTNIARAFMADSGTMSQVKQIYSMGTSGFGPGNITPAAEFNVYADPEAYGLMLDSGIPITIIGFDVCTGEASLNRKELDFLKNSKKPAALFSLQCNSALLKFNQETTGKYCLNLPDAVAMAVVLWEDIVLKRIECSSKISLNQNENYGQVILRPREQQAMSSGIEGKRPNVSVCGVLENRLFKSRLLSVLTE